MKNATLLIGFTVMNMAANAATISARLNSMAAKELTKYIKSIHDSGMQPGKALPMSCPFPDKKLYQYGFIYHEAVRAGESYL